MTRYENVILIWYLPKNWKFKEAWDDIYRDTNISARLDASNNGTQSEFCKISGKISIFRKNVSDKSCLDWRGGKKGYYWFELGYRR